MTHATATLNAEKFARVVNALSVQLPTTTPGAEWVFMIAPGYDITAWVSRAGHLTLQLAEFDGPALRTATVCPGEFRAFDIVAGDREILGETHGAQAAFSIALDYLTAPLRAHVQGEPDPFAV